MVVNVTNYGCWVSNEDHYNPTFEHWGFCTKFINELRHQPLIIKQTKHGLDETSSFIKLQVIQ